MENSRRSNGKKRKTHGATKLRRDRRNISRQSTSSGNNRRRGRRSAEETGESKSKCFGQSGRRSDRRRDRRNRGIGDGDQRGNRRQTKSRTEKATSRAREDNKNLEGWLQSGGRDHIANASLKISRGESEIGSHPGRQGDIVTDMLGGRG
jgi:hypothetical protein